MFPIGDEESRPGSAAPIVMALFAINVAVFIGETQLGPQDLHDLMTSYAVTPRLLLADPGTYWPTLITSMFLHGSWMHLIGNMLFLYIFADNIEDLMGSGPFLLFYVLCGAAAMAAQVAMDPRSEIPVLGASGSISGVLGAYVSAFPHNRVRCIYWIAIFIGLIRVPAGIFLGIWFVMQLLYALGTQGGGGGVAFAAHVGGFVAGMLLLPIFPQHEDVLDDYRRRMLREE